MFLHFHIMKLVIQSLTTESYEWRFVLMKPISLKELEDIGRLAPDNARKSAHEAGTFFSYSENGKIIREYPDGRKTEVAYDERGHVKETPIS